MTFIESYKKQYFDELVNNCIPFWERNCVDKEFGGYFTCLDRDGSVYDTNKFMWMQWRIVWMFSEFYNKLEKNPKWLEIAKNGYEFLTKHGKDAQGRYYFQLNRQGEPVRAPYDAFSDCFAVMGAAAYYKACGLPEAKEEALRAFQSYCARELNPKGEWNKNMPAAKEYLALGFYMMKLNLYDVLKENLGTSEFDSELIKTTEFVLKTFRHPEMGIMFENVCPDGTFDLESMNGRMTNPGHVLEAMWFVMNSSGKLGATENVNKALDIILTTLDYGWDKECEGIYYFKDALGKPHLELQWNMKLWWVHNEALIATAMAYTVSGKEEYLNWFERLHNYAWSHFKDTEYPEWYAYLDRYGKPTHTLKGGKWKTFFHLPRCLWTVSQLQEKT